MDSFQNFISSFKTLEPLSNFQIIDKCKELKINNFKGVFMRDELNAATTDECLVLNTDKSCNGGTHWTSLFIKNGVGYYFDSYGFKPPLEVERYCSRLTDRKYNSFRIQKDGQVICGHYCIYVLYQLSHNFEFYDVLDVLYRYNN